MAGAEVSLRTTKTSAAAEESVTRSKARADT